MKLIPLAALALLAACAAPAPSGQYGEQIMSEQQLKTMVYAQIARYGFQPVKGCYVQARSVPGDDMAKLTFANGCVGRLRPI